MSPVMQINSSKIIWPKSLFTRLSPVVICLCVITTTLLSCTRKQDNGSQVIVKLPETIQSSSKDHFAKIAKLEAMSSADWGFAHPASLAETKCFAVIVEVPAGATSTLATQQCTIDSNPEKNITVSQFAGLAPAGTEIELNIAPGPDRTFHLFAFAAESSNDCQITTVGSLIRKTSLSGPLHIGSKKASIVSGVNNIEITGSYAASTAYDNCEWQTPPPLTGGSIAINSGATYTNSLTVTLANMLPFVASEVYYTSNSSCSSGGSWEPYTASRPGYTLSVGDGPKAVYAKYRDSSGSSSSCLSASILLDQTSPSITLSPPPDVNASSVSSFSFNGSCSDDGLAINWSVGAINGSTTCAAGIYSVSAVDLSALPDGTATVSVTTTDSAGNVGAGSDLILKDVAPPTVTISQPIAASSVNAIDSANLNLNGTCSDNGATISLNIGSLTTTATCVGGTYSTNLNVNSELDGVLNVSAETFDGVGNFGSTANFVIKDTVPPTAILSGLPTGIVLDTSVMLNVVAGDVVEYRYAVSTVTQDDCNNPGLYSGSFPVGAPINVSTVSPALYFICVIGIDLAGNEQSFAVPTIERLTKGPVVVSFVERWSSAPENVGLRNLAIDISPSLSTPLPLDVEVQGTAINGTHYTGFINGRETIVLPAFTSSHTLDVSVIGVSIGNFEKRLSVSLKGSPSNQGVRIGANQVHQLWIEDFSFAPIPINHIAVGSTHSCGINATGKLFCWGRDTNGALGDGAANVDQLYPVPIDVGNSYMSVAVGDSSTCAITTVNSLMCWGKNTNGQLGIGSLTATNVPTYVDTGFAKVSMGLNSTCGLKTDGSVKCWGSQTNGRIGNGLNTGNAVSPEPVTIAGAAVDVTVGTDHACAVRDNGAVYCWGGNTYGQVGDGTTTEALTPVEIATGGGIVQVSGGQYYTCVLRADGKAFCWGQGTWGKLGQGSSSSSSSPVAAQATFNFSSIKAGGNSTCGIDQLDSRLKCWGYGHYGLLGDGLRRTSNFSPIEATLLPGTTTNFSLNGTNACAVSQGKGFCWGGNHSTQLGIGASPITSVIDLTPLVEFTSLSLGRGGCGIAAGGNLWCWGANDLDSALITGNVGDGTSHPRNAMVHVDPSETFASVSFGTRHTCAITTSNNLKCWGLNSDGQIGIGNTINQSLPVTVGSGYLSVSVGTQSTCAIDLSNKLWCWGDNTFGQLGLTNNTDFQTPQPVLPGSDFSLVSVGANTACAVTLSQELFCWGRNNKGQIGDNSTVDRNTPVLIASGIQKVSAGAEVGCYIDGTNNLYCWGQNGDAEIGQGAISPTEYLTPTFVGGSYLDVKVGKNMKGNGPGTHVCGLTTASGVNCWGSSNFGQNAPSISWVVTPTSFEAGTFSAVETGELQTCAKTFGGQWRCRGAAEESQLPLGFSSHEPQLVPRIRF